MNTLKSKYIASQKSKGFILVIIMLVLLTNAVLVMGLISLAQTELQLVANRTAAVKAEYIAEAGLAAAIDSLQQNGASTINWQTTFPPSSSDNYEVTITTGTPVVVVSTGTQTGMGISHKLEIECAISGSSSPYTVVVSQWRQVMP